MASVASQLIKEVTAHALSAVLRMRQRYAQTVLTFRITYVINIAHKHTFRESNIISPVT